jgi:hypothetical protein
MLLDKFKLLPFIKHNNNLGRNTLHVSTDENYSDASLHAEYERTNCFQDCCLLDVMPCGMVDHNQRCGGCS